MPIALQNIYEEVEKRTKGYNFASQMDESDPLVVAKLFDIAGSATWYITEYSTDERTFF